MRKMFAVMLIAGSLAAGVSNTFASERDQFIDSTRPAARLTGAIATGSIAGVGDTSSVRIGQFEHDLK